MIPVPTESLSGGKYVNPNIKIKKPIRTIIPPYQSSISSTKRGVLGRYNQLNISEIPPMIILIKKQYSHPKYYVIIPPNAGPSARKILNDIPLKDI